MTKVVLSVNTISRNLRMPRAVKESEHELILENISGVIATSEHFFFPELSIRLTQGNAPQLIIYPKSENLIPSKNSYAVLLNGKNVCFPQKEETGYTLKQNDSLGIFFYYDNNVFKNIFAIVDSTEQ